MGRPASRIFLAYQAQFTACSGKTPVCLKPVGLTTRVSLSSPSPQEIVERSEIRRTVVAALGALPPEFREAVVLRDVNGLSYDEIAEVTGLEAGTVKSRIFRARRKLAAALLGSGNFSAPQTSKSTGNRRGKGGARA